jgi:hypothetical protein
MKSSELAQKAINRARWKKSEGGARTKKAEQKDFAGKAKDLTKAVIMTITLLFTISTAFVICVALIFSSQKNDVKPRKANIEKNTVKTKSTVHNLNGEKVYTWHDEKGILHISGVPREIAERERRGR